MATVYYASLGQRSKVYSYIHGEVDTFQVLAKLILIDGSDTVDQWMVEPNFRSYDFPQSGRWLVRMSTKELWISDDQVANVLVKARFRNWPLKRWDDCDGTLTKPINGETKCVLFVDRVE